MVSPKTSVTMFLLVTCVAAALAADKLVIPVAATSDIHGSESTGAKKATLVNIPEPEKNVTTTIKPPITTDSTNSSTTTTTTINPLPTTTTTVKPNSTTTTTINPLPTTTTVNPITSSTTTIIPSTSTSSPNSTTVSPNVTTPSPPSDKSRNWDAPSFLGGMVLAFGIVAVGFVGYRFFYLGRGGAYHTL